MITTAREAKQLTKCLKGDPQAFEAIVAKYQELICAITYSGTADVHQSEELAQQSFINAWQNLSQLKDLSSFRPWLCTIARNNIRNFLNKKQRDIIAKAKPMENINDTATDESSPLESAIKKEREELLSDTIRRIPQRYREPLILYYRQQQSVRQVALSLDLSEGVVRQRLQRGRKMIKEQLSSIVEETLSATGPKKAFTTAVIASIAGLAIKGSGAAAAASIGATATTAGTATGVGAIMSGVTAKIITAVAAAAIAVGAVVAYKQVTKPSSEPGFSQAGMAVQGQGEEQEKVTEDVIEPPSDETADFSAIDKTQSDLEGGEFPVASPKSVSTEDAGFKFVPRGVLSGLITDANTGEPISGVEVELWSHPNYLTVTDDNGFYCIGEIAEDGNYKVKVYSPEYLGMASWGDALVIALQKGKSVVKHFELKQACQIDILVVNEANEPIKGVKLVVNSLASTRQVPSLVPDQKTDANGMAILGGLEPTETSYLITATHRVQGESIKVPGGTYRTTKWDYAPGKLIVTLNDPDVIEYGEIILKKGVGVQGYAEYLDGVPAGSLRINAYPQWWCSGYSPEESLVDPNGYFTLSNIVPGTYRIQVNIPYGSGSLGFDVLQTNLPLKDELLQVTIPRRSPSSLVSISGKVRFVGDGKPSLVEVETFSESGPHSAIVQNNAFVIDSLEPGIYSLQFSGRNLEEKTVEKVKAPSSDLEVELRYATKPRINGIVVYSNTSTPVPKFRARVKKVKTLRGTPYVPSSNWTEFSNNEGRFDFEAIGPGVYQVQIAAEGFAWRWSDEINTDENNPAIVKLSTGGTIKGLVVNEQGQPVSGAKVIPLSKAGSARWDNAFISEDGSVKTINGEFMLKNLVEGQETIKITHPDYSQAIVKDIDVTQGATTEDVEVVLVKGGIVQGHVYSITGKPQASETLYFQDMSSYSYEPIRQKAGRLATVITDANGFYCATGLPEQLCYVMRSDEQRLKKGVVRRAIFPTNGKISELDFGGKPVIRGQLIINEEPLANTEVTLADNDSPHSMVFRCYATTDIDGGFSFRGVPIGQYVLYYVVSNRQNTWASAATIDVGEEDMDIGVVSLPTGRVIIFLSCSDPNELLDNFRVYLQQGFDFWGRRAGDVSKPTQQGDPYIATNIPPGNYNVVACRPDGVKIVERIEFEPTSEEYETHIKIPTGTATISGQLIADSDQPLVLWRSGQKIIAHISRPSNSDSYKIENLPAGDYSIGNYFIGASAPLLRFSLSEGEEKVIDIDTLIWSELNKASLHTQVIGSNGVPITGAEVWLERDNTEIRPLTETSQGQFFVTEGGEYTLHAFYPGHEETTKKIWMEPCDITSIRQEDKTLIIRLRRNL